MYVSPQREPLIKGIKNYSKITEEITAPMAGKPGKYWYLGIGISSSAVLIGSIAIFMTVWFGDRNLGDLTKPLVGVGELPTSFGGLGLVMPGLSFPQSFCFSVKKWRTSINRSAEAMTLMAVMCAGFFPLVHMGRLLLGFFIFPYPNTRGVWVNFNSPLLWDVFAISTYFLVSLLFWYVGLIPDIGTIRDRATKKIKKKIYSLLAMGWVGSARHWARHESLSLILAGLAAPLVLSVHSIVSMDFATSVIPGWHTTIFPPYFVSGAIFSGFAMVLTLLIIARKAMNLEDYITVGHVESMNKIIIATGSIVGIAYLTELFIAWYSGVEYEQYAFLNRATGPYWWAYAIMMTCNVITPQLFWFKKIRRNLVATFIISIFVNIGMWFERFVIVVTSLHRDYLPSSWSMYKASIVEVGLYVFTLGLFFTLFLLFIRVFPVIAISEIKSVLKSSGEKKIEK